MIPSMAGMRNFTIFFVRRRVFGDIILLFSMAHAPLHDLFKLLANDGIDGDKKHRNDHHDDTDTR